MLYFSQVQVRRSFVLPSQGDQPRPPLRVDIERARNPWLLLLSSSPLVGVGTRKLRKRRKIFFLILFRPPT
jgi:hypothetical protein